MQNSTELLSFQFSWYMKSNVALVVPKRVTMIVFSESFSQSARYTPKMLLTFKAITKA
jgi:hypothetical protein